MKIEYRNKYIANLYAALHTMSGKCDYVNDSVATSETIVKSCSKKKVRGQDKYEYYLQLNPNKSVKDNTMLKKYSDFEKVVREALNHMEAVNFRISRADLSFNSNDENDYELFKKLNRLLICCIADAYYVKNCYKTSDLWTDKSLSVAIKSDVFEAENYDKASESGGTTDVKNRFEIRSKRVRDTLQSEFMGKWFERLDKALEHFESVQERYNDELERLWFDDITKPERDRDYLSLTSFLIQYRDCIYTRKQLQNLLKKINVENPVSKAKNFKERHRIEFYSKTDLTIIVKALKDATIRYFSN